MKQSEILRRLKLLGIRVKFTQNPCGEILLKESKIIMTQSKRKLPYWAIK
jgi:hypothetical protein